jgi:hypothetical protein
MAEQSQELDPRKIWEEVERVAAKAPQWASLEPPYAVKPGFQSQAEARTESQETRTK